MTKTAREILKSAYYRGLDKTGYSDAELDSDLKEIEAIIEAYVTTRVKEAERLARAEAGKKVFVDITTGHEITEMTTKRAKHDPKCSSKDGFICDCEILGAVVYAVEKSQERIEALTTTANGREELL